MVYQVFTGLEEATAEGAEVLLALACSKFIQRELVDVLFGTGVPFDVTVPLIDRDILVALTASGLGLIQRPIGCPE